MSARTSITAFDGTIFVVGAVVTVYCENDPAEGIGEDGRPIRGKIESIGADFGVSVEFEDGEQGYYGVEDLVLVQVPEDEAEVGVDDEDTDDECSAGDVNWNDMRDPAFQGEGEENTEDDDTADAPAELFSEEWIGALGPVEFI